MSKFDDVMKLWNESEAFRQAFRQDPQGTLKGHGVSLTPDELQALDGVDFSASDEELAARASAKKNC